MNTKTSLVWLHLAFASLAIVLATNACADMMQYKVDFHRLPNRSQTKEQFVKHWMGVFGDTGTQPVFDDAAERKDLEKAYDEVVVKGLRWQATIRFGRGPDGVYSEKSDRSLNRPSKESLSRSFEAPDFFVERRSEELVRVSPPMNPDQLPNPMDRWFLIGDEPPEVVSKAMKSVGNEPVTVSFTDEDGDLWKVSIQVHKSGEAEFIQYMDYGSTMKIRETWRFPNGMPTVGQPITEGTREIYNKRKVFSREKFTLLGHDKAANPSVDLVVKPGERVVDSRFGSEYSSSASYTWTGTPKSNAEIEAESTGSLASIVQNRTAINTALIGTALIVIGWALTRKRKPGPI